VAVQSDLLVLICVDTKNSIISSYLIGSDYKKINNTAKINIPQVEFINFGTDYS